MSSPAILLITSPIPRPPVVPFITDSHSLFLSGIHHQSLRPLDEAHEDILLTLRGEGEAGTGVGPMSAAVGGGSKTVDGAPGSPGVWLEIYFTSESPRLLIDLGGGAIYSVEGG